MDCGNTKFPYTTNEGIFWHLIVTFWSIMYMYCGSSTSKTRVAGVYAHVYFIIVTVEEIANICLGFIKYKTKP